MARRSRRKPGRLRRIGRWFLRGVLVLIILVIGAVAAIYLLMQNSVPPASGNFDIAGLSQPVRIVRDDNGIPHIYARTEADAYRALGFMHARDRLFQMEMQRRIGQGRVAELVGGMAAPLDRFMRTLGLYRRAAASYAFLRPETKRALQAYAAGVNEYLEKRKARLSPGFTLLFAEPEPWKPADSVVWGKLMALQLSTNWRSEILRARIVAALGKEALPVLWPAYPKDGPTTLGDRAGLYRSLPLSRLWASLPHGLIGTGASNQWVLDGTKTVSGKPILANDPHLGMSAPAMWYLARIETPGLTLSGATVPGIPFHVLGHNGTIAWGVTTTYIDTDDLFIERIDPQDPAKYLTPDGPRPFTERKETLHIRFGGKQSFTVRETRHGPVIDRLVSYSGPMPVSKGHVLALQAPWLSAEDTTADALYGINRARTWNQFTGALRRYIGPLQSFVYADTIGNIGYIVPGKIPIRKKGDGFLPQPGWTGEYDWTGFVDPLRLPQAFNPAAGRIVNANNRIATADRIPYFLSHEWGDAYRARRIAQLLDARPKQDADSTAGIQGDIVSLLARDMLPLMLNMQPSGPRADQAVKLLRNWDGAMAMNRPEPLIFYAWFLEVNKRLYADELRGMARSYVSFRPHVVRKILTEEKGWCDNKTTPATESCAQILAVSLDAALDMLAARFGDKMTNWKWGTAHQVHMRHEVLSLVPILGRKATINMPAPGGNSTVNKAATRGRGDPPVFSQRHGAGFRAIYSFDALDESQFIVATGPSGNIFSPFYRNLAERWRDVRYIRFKKTRAAAEKDADGIINLQPAK